MSAQCQAGRISIPYDHALNIDNNHKAACDALVKKLGWNADGYGDMVGGVFDGDHFWVFDDKRLKVLKAFVNSYRSGTWSGNPWGRSEWRDCVAAVGRSYDFFGDALEAPTTGAEAAHIAAKGGAL